LVSENANASLAEASVSETPSGPEADSSDSGGDLAAALAVFSESADETPAEFQQAAPEPTQAPAEPVPPPAEPQPPSQTPPQDDRLARFAEKERELAAIRREIEQERTKVDEKERRLARLEKFEEELQEGDALIALENLGYKFEDLARAAAQGKGLRPNRKLEEKIDRTNAEIERLRSEQNQAQERLQYEAAQAEIRREVTSRSPLLSALGGGEELIIAHAKRHHSEGRTIEYGAVIADAEKEVLAFAEKILSVESVRNRFLPQQSQQVSQPPQKAAPRTTLTNSQATSVSKRVDQPQLDELSKEDLIDYLFANPTMLSE
jgi:hypothetical protein